MPFEAATGAPTVSFSRRLAQLAQAVPDRPAIVLVGDDEHERRCTFGELEHRTNQLARMLQSDGIEQDALVGIALPNSIELLALQWAVWKLGACPLTVNPALPEWERQRLLEVADPALVVGEVDTGRFRRIGANDLAAADELAATPLPDAVSRPYRASGTGGSTGLPKLVFNRHAGVVRDRPVVAARVHLVSGPLYHFGPSLNAEVALCAGNTVVVLEHFDAGRAVRVIARHRVQEMMFVPTMLRRVLGLPDLHAQDLSSVETLISGGGSCADWLFSRAIEVFGAEHVYNGYGGTESIGRTFIRGTDWLSHRGSVGRGLRTDILILDTDGEPVPTGTIGDVWLQPHGATEPSFTYRGAEDRFRHGGFATYGDLGWLDEDGYLYLADRRADMIVSGGANVYPVEVESALLEHPAVQDVAVVGLPDEEWGTRVHALIVAEGSNPAPSIDQLRLHAGRRLAAYKVPKSWENVPTLPKDELGKLRRWQLIEERTSRAGG